MKKSLPIFIFVLLFSLSIKAQESTTFSNTDPSDEITKTSFFEWNFGVALISRLTIFHFLVALLFGVPHMLIKKILFLNMK